MNSYNTAYNTAIIVNLSTRGVIKLSGRDRIDLINRMSTNDLKELQAGQGAATVLTTPIGRMIDLLVFLHDGEQALVITSDGRGERLTQYFRRNIFFNDQVQIAPLNNLVLYGVYGVQAAHLMDEYSPGAAKLAPYHFLKNGNTTIIRAESLAGGGFWLLGSATEVQKILEPLIRGNISEADQSTYELLCIESGYPLPQHELTEDYIPLEAGLWHAVSFSKGCYTGQEIIARMESRGKLAKMLVRLVASEQLEAGSALFDSDGNTAGTLTSIALQPGGDYLGLGFIKTAYVSDHAVLYGTDGVRVKIVGIAGTQPQR